GAVHGSAGALPGFGDRPRKGAAAYAAGTAPRRGRDDGEIRGGRKTDAHPRFDLRGPRGAEGNRDRARRGDAEGRRHGSAAGTRKDAGPEDFSGAVRKGAAELA